MVGYISHVDGLSTPEVCRLAGVTYRQLDYWARTDLLLPSIADARGSGSKRRYSIEDAALALLLSQMMQEGGVSSRAARRVAAVLRADPSAWDAFLVLVDGAVIVTITPGTVLADRRTTAAWVIAPQSALDDIRAALDDIDGEAVPT